MLQSRHRVADWIIKQKPKICHLQEILFREENIYIESKGIEKGVSCKWK